MTTQSIISLLVLLLILVAAIFRVVFWPRLRIARIRKRAFPEAWQQTLLERLPFVARIPLPEKEQLQFLIKVCLADKSFYGCAGQEIDDDIRVTVAAQACLLILNQKREPYPELDSILIYPSTFVATREVANELGLVSTNHIAMLEESWSQGKVRTRLGQCAERREELTGWAQCCSTRIRASARPRVRLHQRRAVAHHTRRLQELGTQF